MGKGGVVGEMKSEKQQSRHCVPSEKSSAVTFNLLNDVQILNCCYTAEMLLTDLAIVVKSNCLLQTCFSELGLYVSQWKKMVPTVITVISLFLSQNSLPAVFSSPTALPASLAIFISLILCFVCCFSLPISSPSLSPL